MKNLAKVHYKKVKGKYVIVQFEGFKTTWEISEAYGDTVFEKYVDTPQRMYRREDSVEFMGESKTVYSVNQKMGKKSFIEMIDLMKEAGQNLVDSIRKAREPEIKIIEI